MCHAHRRTLDTYNSIIMGARPYTNQIWPFILALFGRIADWSG